MPAVKWSGVSAWAAILSLTRQAVPEADMDLHIDVRRKFRAYEKSSGGKDLEATPAFKAEFSEAELTYLQQARQKFGEKVGWPPDLVEGARDLKRAIETALKPAEATVAEEPKKTRQARRLADQKASA